MKALLRDMFFFGGGEGGWVGWCIYYITSPLKDITRPHVIHVFNFVQSSNKCI